MSSSLESAIRFAILLCVGVGGSGAVGGGDGGENQDDTDVCERAVPGGDDGVGVG